MVTVYHVNFLRAKSRRDRWREEKILLESEMEWCMLYFKHWQQKWHARINPAALRPGHDAYALRQARVWGHLAAYAQFGMEEIAKMAQVQPRNANAQ